MLFFFGLNFTEFVFKHEMRLRKTVINDPTHLPINPTTCYPPDITSQEDIFMSDTMTKRDLAMTFYNEFVENGGDVYDPDSKFSKLMGEIDEALLNLLDFKSKVILLN